MSVLASAARALELVISGPVVPCCGWTVVCVCPAFLLLMLPALSGIRKTPAVTLTYITVLPVMPNTRISFFFSFFFLLARTCWQLGLEEIWTYFEWNPLNTKLILFPWWDQCDVLSQKRVLSWLSTYTPAALVRGTLLQGSDWPHCAALVGLCILKSTPCPHFSKDAYNCFCSW